MLISVVVAMSENRVIGRGGEIPWRLPSEQRAVRELTMGHCLIMGRKTWDTIARALPGRTSIVVTRNPGFSVALEDVLVTNDFDVAVEIARGQGDDEVFVFGGEAIYALGLPKADRLYLTTVHADVEGDAFFPTFDESAWKLVEETRHEADDRDDYAYTMARYERA